jgi:hypothetical protein
MSRGRVLTVKGERPSWRRGEGKKGRGREGKEGQREEGERRAEGEKGSAPPPQE